jgi:hypothetical protein
MGRRTGQCNGGSASDAGHGSVADGGMSATTSAERSLELEAEILRKGRR